MAEIKHTPGPWHYGEDSVGRLEVSTDKRRIAKINVAFMDGEAEGNASLIAAAPELLQELQNIANADTVEWDYPSDFEAWAKSRARRAIAKATGSKSCPKEHATKRPGIAIS